MTGKRVERSLTRPGASFKIEGDVTNSSIEVAVEGMIDLDFAKSYNNSLMEVISEIRRLSGGFRSILFDMTRSEIYPRDVADYLNSQMENYHIATERIAIVNKPSAIQMMQMKRIASQVEMHFFDTVEAARNWIDGAG